MLTKRILICMLYLLSLSAISQVQVKVSEGLLYTWCDSIIGQPNTGLFNGLTYVEKHRMINEKHKFFKDFNFSSGKVIYDGKPFDKIKMKYNIYEDQLILKYSFAPSDPSVLINQTKIDGFIISGHEFVNLNIELEKGEIVKGFFERIFSDNSIQVLKKYQKRIRNRTNDRIKYHEFEDDNAYYVYMDKKHILIKNPKKLERQFSKYKSIIDKISLDKTSIDDGDYDAYLIKVFTAISKS